MGEGQIHPQGIGQILTTSHRLESCCCSSTVDDLLRNIAARVLQSSEPIPFLRRFKTFNNDLFCEQGLAFALAPTPSIWLLPRFSSYSMHDSIALVRVTAPLAPVAHHRRSSLVSALFEWSASAKALVPLSRMLLCDGPTHEGRSSHLTPRRVLALLIFNLDRI